MVDVAIHDKEEQIAARMRQVALAGTRPNQQQADLRPESGPRSKGLSAEIVAKKIGKSKNDVKAIRAIQKPDKAVPEVAKLVRRLIRVRGNSLAFVVDTAPSISSRSQSWRGQVYQVRPAVSLNDSRAFCRMDIKTFAMLRDNILIEHLAIYLAFFCDSFCYFLGLLGISLCGSRRDRI